MNGLCNSDNVVYQAIIYPKENINDKKYNIGISSTNFKIRYGNHKFSFSHAHQKNQTALSKHYWGLKVKGLTPEIQWSILRRSSTPKSFDSRDSLPTLRLPLNSSTPSYYPLPLPCVYSIFLSKMI